MPLWAVQDPILSEQRPEEYTVYIQRMSVVKENPGGVCCGRAQRRDCPRIDGVPMTMKETFPLGFEGDKQQLAAWGGEEREVFSCLAFV